MSTSKKTWLETERQGNGRRYWFRYISDARAFATERTAAGWFVCYEGRDSAWVANSKKPSAEKDLIASGVDPLSAKTMI